MKITTIHLIDWASDLAFHPRLFLFLQSASKRCSINIIWISPLIYTSTASTLVRPELLPAIQPYSLTLTVIWFIASQMCPFPWPPSSGTRCLAANALSPKWNPFTQLLVERWWQTGWVSTANTRQSLSLHTALGLEGNTDKQMNKEKETHSDTGY